MRIVYNKDPHVKGNAKDLTEHPVIIRVGEINEKTASEFSLKMTDAYNTGQTIVPVVIDSYGGDAYALFSMLSDIESCKLPVATICVGKAMSAGAVLLAHGEAGARFMCPNATLMIHEVSSWNYGKLAEIKADVNEAERLNQIIFQKMAMACGHKDKAYFFKMIDQKKNADWFLNCFDAKKHKIIDQVGRPELQVNISMSMDFMFSKPRFIKK